MIDLKNIQFKTLSDPIYIGSHKIDAIYKGNKKIYPTGLLGGWVPITFGGLDKTVAPSYIWKDGNMVYYLSLPYPDNHYVFDKSTQSWEPIKWYRYKTNRWGQETSEIVEFYINGISVWTDGNDTYLSRYYVLDRETSIWRRKTWTNIPSDFDPKEVWTDGTYTYYKLSHVLNGSTWSTKDWGDVPSDLNQDWAAKRVWTDGTNVYFSGWIDDNGFAYVLNKQTSRWEKKIFYFRRLDGTVEEWYPYTGGDFVFDGLDGNMYYANVFGSSYSQTDSAVLKKGGSIWTPIEFNPIPLRDSDGVYYLFGNYIWSDGIHVYYSYGGAQYKNYILQ